MLNVAAPFPAIGATALLVEACQALPVRIMANGPGRGANREVQVAILGRDGASATRRLPLSSLLNADPLSPAEAAELAALEAALAGKAVDERSPAYKRCMALWHRQQHAARREEAEARLAARAGR